MDLIRKLRMVRSWQEPNVVVKINGNCQIKTKIGDNTALYLTEVSKYLEVTGEDGSSLLKGQYEVINFIRYQSRTDNPVQTGFATRHRHGDTEV